MAVRQLVIVFQRQQPFLILFLVLATMSGVGFWVQAADPEPSPVPMWLAQAWAYALFATGLMGLAGIAWQRWRMVSGKMLLRGTLMLQAGAVAVYVGLLGLYLRPAEWAVVLVIAAAWVWVNLWECRLLAREIGSIGEVTGER